MRSLRELSAGARPSLSVQVGLIVAAVVVVLDQATKEVAETWLTTGEYVPFLGERIGWQLVYNPGGAFGLPAPPWLFLIVTLLVVGIVARTLPTTRTLLPALAYGLLLAGALGNMVDRLLRAGEETWLGGHVVDFVAWGGWPRFNVADSAISVGFALLVVALWREERDSRSAPGRTDVPPGAEPWPGDPPEAADGAGPRPGSVAGKPTR